MPTGCPIDLNVLYCMVRYEPELLLLVCLILVCGVLAVKSTEI